jgi:hypothetical protein
MANDMDVMPYPEFDDKDFYRKIYIKKEFNKTKIDQSFLDQDIAEACSTVHFNLQGYQEFLRNYISSSTPYNGILAFWGVGTGKCLDPETEVYVNGCLKTIQSIWNEYQTPNLRKDQDGDWSIPSELLVVNTYNSDLKKICEHPVTQLYRQHVHEMVNVIELQNGLTLRLTKNHHLLTEKGWSSDLKNVKLVAVPSILQNSYHQSPIGKNLAIILGYHVACGIYSESGILRFVHNNRTNLEKIKEKFLELVNTFDFVIDEIKIEKDQSDLDEECFELIIDCKDYRNLLNRYQCTFITEIPDVIMKASNSEIAMFLQSYCECAKVDSNQMDQEMGSLTKLTICGINYHLTQQLHHLLKLFAIQSEIDCEHHIPRLTVTDFYSKITSLEAPQESLEMIPIVKCSEEEYSGYVYDLEVGAIDENSESPHNYIAGGIICHNTCAAIQVSEGLKETVEKLGKKIYIISSKQIRPNFLKELYNKDKALRETVPGSNQCTGSTYYIPKSEVKNEAQRERKVLNKIKKNYRFFGPQSFCNYVDVDVKSKTTNVGEFFSDSVIVIDEAHGLADKDRDDTGKPKKPKKLAKVKKSQSNGSSQDSKKTKKPKKEANISKRGILTVLEEILSQSTGIKLVLLTATPMKDHEQELVDIIDLLRINDKKPKIDRARLFPSTGDIDEKYLAEVSKGYVSYVRGENPVTFPKIKEATDKDLRAVGNEIAEDTGLAYLRNEEPITYMPSPIYDANGQVLPSQGHNYVQYSHLIRCPMSNYQFSNYQKAIKKSDGSGKTSSVDQIRTMASNIIFPISSDPTVGSYGNDGFDTTFEEVVGVAVEQGETKAKNKLTAKPPTQYKYRSWNEGFLDLKEIGKYSKKFEMYLKNVIKSQGIIYTFSDFKYVGAIIIALMLEENGYVRFKPRSKDPIKAKSLLISARVQRYRCALCGYFNDDDRHTEDNIDYHEFVQATYVIFTGDVDDKRYMQEEIEFINDPKNFAGQIIKIVIGTKVSGEGIDFKRVREVHIIDPWHNNTRLYQVIGRAARHCSHQDLDLKLQNVTTFKYCSAPPIYKDDLPPLSELMSLLDQQYQTNQKGLMFTYRELLTATGDEIVYNRVEQKDTFVKRVERILKKNAVDCELNRAANILPVGKSGKYVFPIDGSRECDYTKCEYQCAGDVHPETVTPDDINLDTYNLHFSEPQINRAQKSLYDLFKVHFVMDLESIIYLVRKNNKNLEREYINEALDRLVGNPPQRPPLQVIDRFNRSGHVIFRVFDKSSYYLFQPDDLDDNKAPLYYRVTPLTIKKSFLNLDQLKSETVGQQVQAQKQPLISGQTEIVKIAVDGEIALLLNIKNKYEIEAKLDRLTPDIQQAVYETVYETVHGIAKPSPKYVDLLDHLINYFKKLDKLYYIKLENDIEYLGHCINTGFTTQTDAGSKSDSNAKTNVRLYTKATRKWETVSISSENIIRMRQFMASFLIKKAEQSKVRPLDLLHGFIKYEKGEYKFKLVDKEKENVKKVKANIVSKKKASLPVADSEKSKLGGKVCSTFLKPDLIEYAKKLDIKITTNETRPVLCQLIELKLREIDEGNSNAAFLTQQEVGRYYDKKET